MKLKLIACRVMEREISHLAAACPHTLDIVWMKQGLHNEPGRLHAALQREIDLADAQAGGYDAILLDYGLCSGGTAGVRSAKYPMVLPRAHDCITLFLGSKERYRRIFEENGGGVYWYTAGWIENCPMPSEPTEREKLRQYTELYGADNASFLVEAERAWLSDYRCLAFIETPGAPPEPFRAFTRQAAAYFGLPYAEFAGGAGLLRDFLGGDWDEDRFLVLPPGQTAEPSGDDSVIRPTNRP